MVSASCSLQCFDIDSWVAEGCPAFLPEQVEEEDPSRNQLTQVHLEKRRLNRKVVMK